MDVNNSKHSVGETLVCRKLTFITKLIVVFIPILYLFILRCSKTTFGTSLCLRLSHLNTLEMAAALKVKRSTSKTQFTRCEKRLNDVLSSPANVPVSTIERRYSELREKWDAAHSAHSAYLEALEAEGSKIDDEEAWMDEVTDRFDSIELKTDTAIEKMKQSSATSTVSLAERSMEAAENSSKEGHGASSVQLERVKLEHFDGDIRKYPKFREQFELYVKPLCKSSQLPFVLRSHLSDSVREEVDNIDDNLETLWTRLDKKYGNRGKQLDAILSDIAKAPRGDGKSTLQMIMIVEKANRDLKRMGCESEMYNGTVLAMIEKKLPDEIRFEWIQAIAENEDANSEVKVQKMLKLLEKWRVMIEYDHAAIRKIPEKKVIANHTTRSASTASTNKKKEKENCWIHTAEKHPIWVCQAFKAMQPKERRALAEEKGACLACLEVKCPGAENSSNCKRKFSCTVSSCKEAHSKLLHL